MEESPMPDLLCLIYPTENATTARADSGARRTHRGGGWNLAPRPSWPQGDGNDRLRQLRASSVIMGTGEPSACLFHENCVSMMLPGFTRINFPVS